MKKLILFLLIPSLIFNIWGFGMGLNLFAKQYNDFKMPVYSAIEVCDNQHVCYTNASTVFYPSLSDKYYINHKIYSIGDLIIWLSIFIAGIYAIFIIPFTFYKSFKIWKQKHLSLKIGN